MQSAGTIFSNGQRQQRTLRELIDHRDEYSARQQLLRYQVQELDELALEEGELGTLEQEQRQLASAEDTLRATQNTVQLCAEEQAGVPNLVAPRLRGIKSADRQARRTDKR